MILFGYLGLALVLCVTSALLVVAANRASNGVRLFMPDYQGLYGRRPDTESINSLLVRCSGQWGRAHSYGWRRQFLDLVGFAHLINAGAAASFERRVAAGRPPDAATP